MSHTHHGIRTHASYDNTPLMYRLNHSAKCVFQESCTIIFYMNYLVVGAAGLFAKNSANIGKLFKGQQFRRTPWTFLGMDFAETSIGGAIDLGNGQKVIHSHAGYRTAFIFLGLAGHFYQV